jgi:hypothetical protein
MSFPPERTMYVPIPDDSLSQHDGLMDAAAPSLARQLGRWTTLLAGVGIVLLALAAIAGTRQIKRTIRTGPPSASSTFSCGSALLPTHYSEAKARRMLGFKPAVITASDAVNGGCDFDIRGRRIRCGLVFTAGGVLIAAGLWPPRRRFWVTPVATLAGVLLLFGLPRLFGTG